MYEVCGQIPVRGLMMRDLDLDRALDAARPPSTADDARPRQAAVVLAQQVAISGEVPAARRKYRVKLIGGLGLSLVLVGGAAAAAAPILMDWPPWESDAMIEREFPIPGGDNASCAVGVRVLADEATAGADGDARLEKARHFLETHDWSSLETITIEEIPAEELEGLRRQGISDELILTMNVSEQVGDAFQVGGYLGDGVSLEQAARCGPKDSE